jgi:hypothetical protein
MKNKKGFVQLLLITTLPIFIGCLIIIYSVAGLLQLNTRVNSECRRMQIHAQVEVRKIMIKLLSKNTEAIRLRTQLTQAHIARAAALASGNLPMVETIELRIQTLNQQRLTLDIYQKSFITAANLLSMNSSFKTYTQTLKETKHINGLLPIARVHARVVPPTPPRLPVLPEYTDIAPPYKPAYDFSNKQALVQKWQYHFTINTALQSFIQKEIHFEKLCSTTLESKGDEWIITTKEDKF